MKTRILIAAIIGALLGAALLWMLHLRKSAHVRPPETTARSPGFATPEAAFESFAQAVRQHDFKAFLACSTVEDQKAIEPEWQRMSDASRAALFAALEEQVNGFRVAGRKVISSNEVELTLSRSNESRPLRLKKIGDEWKFYGNAEPRPAN